MKMNAKQFKLKIFIGAMIIFLLLPNLYSYITYNWSECGLEPGCEYKALISSGGDSIGGFIVRAAGYFLNSHSAWNTLLNRVEMSELNGLDYAELREYLYRSIEEMEKACAAYTDLKAAADKTAYVQSVIDRLLTFDYYSFQKEMGLNAVIFSGVRYYLGKGDIRGIYNAALNKATAILDSLYKLKILIDADTLPGIQDLWRINQTYVEFGLFGQYVSQVFYAILYSK